MYLYQFLKPISESVPVTVSMEMYDVQFESRHLVGFDWPSKIANMEIEKVFMHDDGLYIRLKN